jgi:hypothetical protein
MRSGEHVVYILLNLLHFHQDLQNCIDKIEVVDYHETVEVKGIKFSATAAGHVLGAAMFMIDIDGTRVLYTGDYSLEEDRYLKVFLVCRLFDVILSCCALRAFLFVHQASIRRAGTPRRSSGRDDRGVHLRHLRPALQVSAFYSVAWQRYLTNGTLSDVLGC